jgi:hypothetical protein
MELLRRVGPVLTAGAVADAVIVAIRDLNPEVELVDRGSYVRVMVRGRCVVTREAVERHLGRRFTLPGDLERIMPSFAGRFSVSAEEAVWTLAAPEDR